MTYNLRPSASSIWTKCHANPRISENAKTVPSESDAAKEGTCAAWVAECVLKGSFANCDAMIGMNHPENGWLVTDEMAYYCQEYVENVRSHGKRIVAEQYVRLTDYIAGTFDAGVLSDDGTTLHIDDLKYGFKIVDVYENTQTIIYGYGELLRRNDPNITHVVLGIYQPRAWHPEGIYRTWKLSVSELHALASDIAAAGNAAQDPQALATPGSHCEYCKGRLECAALPHTLYAWADVLERREQGAMTAEELSKEKLFLDKLKDMWDARVTAVDAEMKHRIENGEYVPVWGLKDRFGHRKFKVDAMTVHAKTGIVPFKTVEMTPAELEKAGADKKIMKDLTYSPVIGKKLEKFTDKDFGRMFRDR